MAHERTFAMIKSGAILRGKDRHILSYIVNTCDLTLDVMLRTRLNPEKIRAFYGEHVNKPYWPDLECSVSGPVILMVLSGPHAVRVWRGCLGETDPVKAAPNSLRSMYGSPDGPMADNAVHGSDGIERANAEIELMLEPYHMSHMLMANFKGLAPGR